jgi:hypothetical protein
MQTISPSLYVHIIYLGRYKEIDKTFMMLTYRNNVINRYIVYMSHNGTVLKTWNSVLQSGVVIVPFAATDVVRSRASIPALMRVWVQQRWCRHRSLCSNTTTSGFRVQVDTCTISILQITQNWLWKIPPNSNVCERVLRILNNTCRSQNVHNSHLKCFSTLGTLSEIRKESFVAEVSGLWHKFLIQQADIDVSKIRNVEAIATSKKDTIFLRSFCTYPLYYNIRTYPDHMTYLEYQKASVLTEEFTIQEKYVT